MIGHPPFMRNGTRHQTPCARYLLGPSSKSELILLLPFDLLHWVYCSRISCFNFHKEGSLLYSRGSPRQMLAQYTTNYLCAFICGSGGTSWNGLTCLEMVVSMFTFEKTIQESYSHLVNRRPDTWPLAKKIPYFLMPARTSMTLMFHKVDPCPTSVSPFDYALPWSVFAFEVLFLELLFCLSCKAFLLPYEVCDLCYKVHR